MKKVWVLGSKHNNVAKYIEWKPPFPNFSDADILIINLSTLDLEMDKAVKSGDYKLQNSLYSEVRRYIFDMLMATDKQIIVIMAPSPNYLSWLPIYPDARKIASANLNEFEKDTFVISKYLLNVQNCSYYIHNMNMDYFIALTNPESPDAENYSFSEIARQYYHTSLHRKSTIINSAKQIVGGTYLAHIHYGQTYRNEVINEQQFFSSPITYLPFPTKTSTELTIDSPVDANLLNVSFSPIL